ncbi:MAG TPA: hypothetical protein VLA88_02545 [Candidatus Saccharimonadales bacterium]|nr:hypothetical protein [Candidatus Saccharimonadales bacterium]
MSIRFSVALILGAALFFPFLYALKVTIEAFRTSPMERIVPQFQRGAALVILGVATVYAVAVGVPWLYWQFALSDAAALAWALCLTPLPIGWWVVSRQAHAQFDPNALVCFNNYGWVIRRAIRQFLKKYPDETVEVRTTNRDVYVLWEHDGRKADRRFTFETRGQASRHWARIYALGPDTDQHSSLTFMIADGDRQPRARISQVK